MLSFLLSSVLAAALPTPLDFYEPAPEPRSSGHSPFIGHLIFRSLADHVIDQNTQWFDPEDVMPGDLIYLNIWYLSWFEKTVHDQIRNPYVLITCDVGSWVPDPTLQRLLYDPKCAAWFCRNMLFSYHPKLFQIPMGQDLDLIDGFYPLLTDFLTHSPAEKKHLLYMNHLPRAHGDRDKIIRHFENKPFCYSRNDSSLGWRKIPPNVFYEEMAASRFILSPIGYETDTVRTWEALALGTIPIVEHTFLDPLFEGLPVAFVHDWTEIDPPFLEKKYEELKNLKNDDAFIEPWRRRIRDAQERVRKNDLAHAKLDATQFSQEEIEDLSSLLEGEKDTLLYKGFITAARPLQLSLVLPFVSKVYLYDPWLTPQTFTLFGQFIDNPSLLVNKGKITVHDTEEKFNWAIDRCKGFPVFLDLTYFRHSLLTDFRDLRHRLKRDIWDLYGKLQPGTLLTGNMAKDSYVRESLEKLMASHGLAIQTKGNFWFLRKE